MKIDSSLLSFFLVISLFIVAIGILFVATQVSAMDNTPPLHIPEHLKDRIEIIPSSAGSTDVRRTISSHHVHDIETFTGTIKNDEGKDVVIEIKQDTLHESDNDNKTVQISKKMLVLSHGATMIITALVSAGTTVGIAYAKCHQ